MNHNNCVHDHLVFLSKFISLFRFKTTVYHCKDLELDDIIPKYLIVLCKETCINIIRDKHCPQLYDFGI